MIGRIKKLLGLPACRHKWECINILEANRGYKPIFKCRKCGAYQR